MRIVDTAGLRDTTDKAEQAGVARSQELVADADLVLHTSDLPDTWPALDTDPSRVLRVGTKSDLVDHIPGGIAVSATTGGGVADLRREICRRLQEAADGRDVGPVRERHRVGLEQTRDACVAARGHLKAGDLELAATELRAAGALTEELLGRDVDEEVLDRIFSAFCIGK